MKTAFLLLTFLFITFSTIAQARFVDGVEQVIGEDYGIDRQTLANSPDSSTSGGDSSSAAYFEDAGGKDNYISFAMDSERMRNEIAQELGPPDAGPLVLVLFSLAALLQIARVATGKGDWFSFYVRIVVILCFITGFNSIFTGVEGYARLLTKNITGGQPAQELVYGQIKSAMDQARLDFSDGEQDKQALSDNPNYDPSYNQRANSILKFAYGIKSAFSVTNTYGIAASIIESFVLATQYLLYILQVCLLILFQYLGPYLIALAIIPEIDFTPGYLSGVFQVLSWSILSALLLKLGSTTITINFAQAMDVSDFITLCVMGLCFAGANLMIPVIAAFLFTGKGGGGMISAGMAVAGSTLLTGASVATGMVANMGKGAVGLTTGVAGAGASYLMENGDKLSNYIHNRYEGRNLSQQQNLNISETNSGSSSAIYSSQRNQDFSSSGSATTVNNLNNVHSDRYSGRIASEQI